MSFSKPALEQYTLEKAFRYCYCRGTLCVFQNPHLAPAAVQPGWRWSKQSKLFLLLSVKILAMAMQVFLTDATVNAILGWPMAAPSLLSSQNICFFCNAMLQRHSGIATHVPEEWVTLGSPMNQEVHDQLRRIRTGINEGSPQSTRTACTRQPSLPAAS